MPLKLDIKRKLSNRSERVKAVDFHPTEPWLLAALYNGNVYIYNYETQTLVKTFEITDLPVRAAKFIARKSWLVSGSDDMTIQVYNYNTHEKVVSYEAHADYIRSIAVHASQPFILTASDDMLIKLWDWDRNWKNIMVFEGHSHYVMQVTFNPKDSNTFASASLDKSIKIWSLGSSTPNYTLDGHEKGANCVDYYFGGDKPYLVSGGDDKLIKVWDYQNKSCVQVLEGHTNNITVVCYHPELPIIISGSEDGTIRIWHANTYRLENTLNYGMERVWALAYLRGSNDVAFGYDEGVISIKLGREEPAVSMDNSGKIIWAKHSEIQTANVKSNLDEEVKDGERLVLPIKDLGSCEVYPQSLTHSPNGRFVVVCGDGEYIIYTALAWRNKSFGSALEFVWALDSNEYAIRESSSRIKLYKSFKEKTNVGIRLFYSAEGIYGGTLLGVKSSSFICFYDWETGILVRRIDANVKNVYWSESNLVVLAAEDGFFVLKFNRQAFEAALPSLQGDEGVENAFQVESEIDESIKTGTWVGDCFIYTSNSNRLNYLVGGQSSTISHFDLPMYILGYIPRDNRIYLTDKDLNVVSFSLPLTLIEYQTAVLRGDLHVADQILPTVPEDQRSRIARFLEAQGLKEQALAVATDPDHRFDLSIQLDKLDLAHEIASQVNQTFKWRVLGDAALSKWDFSLAEMCMKASLDLEGLLILYQSSGNATGFRELASLATKNGKYNIAFMAYLLLGDVQECLGLLSKTHRVPEAALMARTFAPSQVHSIVSSWKQELLESQKIKIAQAIADPLVNPGLFPDFNYGLLAEEGFNRKKSKAVTPAHEYSEWKESLDWNVIEQLKQRFPDPCTLPTPSFNDFGSTSKSKQVDPGPKAPSVTSTDDVETMSFRSMEVHATASSKGEQDYEDSLDHVDEEEEVL